MVAHSGAIIVRLYQTPTKMMRTEMVLVMPAKHAAMVLLIPVRNAMMATL